MGDDLDDLLDEIEGKLVAEPHIQVDSNKAVANTTSSGFLDSGSELDQAIADICNYDSGDESTFNSRLHLSPNPFLNTGSNPPPYALTLKCSPLLLGGAVIVMGQSTRASEKACDRLRCTACDFHVMSFDNYVWHSRSDYLFFRNNVPDVKKLQKNLVKKRGSRAYACQCQWESVEGAVEVSTLKRLKWVCGKHPHMPHSR